MNESTNDTTNLTDEKHGIICKDCEPTFLAFLEEMAARNAETVAELQPKVVCPTCGKVHEYPASNPAMPKRSEAS